MNRYVALLRGIAPALPNNSNAQLRAVLEGLGHERVESVLASGNILFRTEQTDVPRLERTIQAALVAELGIGGGTIVRELGELEALIERDPFDGLVHGRGTYLVATFLKDGAPLPSELPDDPDPRVRVVGFDADARAFLAVIDNGDPGKTPDFMRWLDRTYGKDITTRTWLTVQRIVTKLAAG
ncbi:DUF1697 domain-containing protein [Janibacter anophelis]|uniref:DUF1697 domain-containing protein n=1 Tax=Janibacter anophelis TaxID=319054 RepID=UPI000836AB06|nr:DUF1697 domain-containing protein [Janibacter anophelis]